MPFETDGFIASEMNQWIQRQGAGQPAWVDLALRLNRYSHGVANRLQIGSGNSQQMLCATLFLRLLEHFQGAFVMLDRGMINSAKALLRSQVEATFSLCALEKKPDETVRAEIEKKDIHEIKVRWLAEQAGMTATYNAVYPYLCWSVHANSEGTVMCLSIGVEMLLLALAAIERLFKVESHQSLREEFEKLVALLPANERELEKLRSQLARIEVEIKEVIQQIERKSGEETDETERIERDLDTRRMLQKLQAASDAYEDLLKATNLS